jgi:hypothetical protein
VTTEEIQAILKKSARCRSRISDALRAAGCHSTYADSVGFHWVTEWARLAGLDPLHRVPSLSSALVADMAAAVYSCVVAWDWSDTVPQSFKCLRVLHLLHALDGTWGIDLHTPLFRCIPDAVWERGTCADIARLLLSLERAMRSVGKDDMLAVHVRPRRVSESADGEVPLCDYLDHVAENSGRG